MLVEINLVPFQPVNFIDSFICSFDTKCDSYSPATFSITYHLTGDLQWVRWPDEEGLQHFCDELWRHTCFEYFIGVENKSSYCEFNQSPNGNWACYEFSNYRSRIIKSNKYCASGFYISRDSHECYARLEVPSYSTHSFFLGISTVIRDIDDQLHYFAHSHPDNAPDFHDRAHHQLIMLETL